MCINANVMHMPTEEGPSPEGGSGADRMESILPPGWPRPKGYSNAWRVPAGRDLLFLAGMVGWDEHERLAGPDFVAQFERALANCLALVETAGGGAGDIVRLTMFCTDRRQYLDRLPEVGAAYRRVMGRNYPAMSLVQVAALVEPGALIEIEATAALPPAGPTAGRR